MKQPKLPPKRVFIYSLRKGFFSVNQYINAKQRNIVKPFKMEDDQTILKLQEIFVQFRKLTDREIVAVATDIPTKALAKKLGLKIE